MADYSKDFSLLHDDEAGSCSIRFQCFDTPNSITAYASSLPDREVEDCLIGLFRNCLDVHKLWSFSLPESDISRLNGEDAFVRVDARTACLLQEMKAFHVAEPSFDFTIGPVSFLWKQATSIPPDARLEEALSHVGADKVSIDGCMVEKGDARIKVDVGGAAKGFVADWVAGKLRACGITCADVDLGGNLYMMGGHPQGRPWRVSIRVPEGIEVDRKVVEVTDCSIVTSGAYERFAEIGGRRYQHIVDPRTGWPSESDVVSATVIAKSSLMADMLATTVLLVGSAGFAELSERHPECRIIALVQDGPHATRPDGNVGACPARWLDSHPPA